jgi:protein TonB
MMTYGDRKERLTSLAAVAVLHVLLGLALFFGLAPSVIRQAPERLAIFAVTPETLPPPEPEPVRERPAPRPARREAAAPANVQARPKPVAAPKPLVRTPLPRPTPAPPVAGSGTQVMAGAGARPGPGTGAGGSGAGTGGGGSANGGGGGSGGAVARAQLRSGRIAPADYPRAANGAQGLVVTRLTVSATGSVASCSVSRSSGNPVLDATTCRLIRERFRFTPARDAAGNAIPDVKGWQQRWWRD